MAQPDSLLSLLKEEIKRRDHYDRKKENKIRELKTRLNSIPQNKTAQQYRLYDLLYLEYKDYKFDSARVYCNRLLQAATSLNSLSKKYESQIKLANIQVSWGMFKEAFDLINQMQPDSMENLIKFRYYELKSQAYTRLSLYNKNKFYSPNHRAESREALLVAMRLAPSGSYEKLWYTGAYYRDLKLIGKARSAYQGLLDKSTLSAHQRAMALHDLGSLLPYNQRKKLLIQAAIYDIRSSTKETLAIFSLASMLLQEGSIDDAEVLLHAALQQSRFYGNQLQEEEITIALQSLSAKKLLAVGENRNFILSLLTLALAVAICGTGIIFYKVYRKLTDVKRREALISDQNCKLDLMNKDLSALNTLLSEASSIKEEYIGYFLNIISGHIHKLERVKRLSERAVRNENFKELTELAESINIKEERRILFHTFDTIFLKLFPNFIDSFNSLLTEEDKIIPKKTELLNTNLRIFALMRLGVRDNQAIANILESKVNTIYTYKFRIKSRSLLEGDEFDQKIMEIKFNDLI